MSTCDLADRSCEPCRGGVPPLAPEAVAEGLRALPEWRLSEDGTTITRRLAFKGFAKAVQAANVAAFVGDREGHHPDIRFGWGYCEVAFTTHEAGGLTGNDLICAAKLDRVLG